MNKFHQWLDDRYGHDKSLQHSIPYKFSEENNMETYKDSFHVFKQVWGTLVWEEAFNIGRTVQNLESDKKWGRHCSKLEAEINASSIVPKKKLDSVIKKKKEQTIEIRQLKAQVKQLEFQIEKAGEMPLLTQNCFEDNLKLDSENFRLRKENFRLRKENGDLRLALALLKLENGINMESLGDQE